SQIYGALAANSRGCLLPTLNLRAQKGCFLEPKIGAQGPFKIEFWAAREGSETNIQPSRKMIGF
ncbi:MAG: hypothetical protein KDD22_00670, partial [Bdellovibrionales bacterium]|nr:hypothetical protein [Bdellovibrionales bacterium]